MMHFAFYSKDLTSVNHVHLYFHCAYKWFATIMLACMLDSLVRVPRRGGNTHGSQHLDCDFSGPTTLNSARKPTLALRQSR